MVQFIKVEKMGSVQRNYQILLLLFCTLYIHCRTLTSTYSISPDTHILGFWIIFNTLNQQPPVCKFSTSRVTFHDCSSTKETIPSKLLTWSHQFEVKELTFCVHTERRRSEKCQQIGKGLSQLLRFILWPFWPFCLMPQNKLAVSWVI